MGACYTMNDEPSRYARRFLADFPAIVRAVGLGIIVAETTVSILGIAEASPTVLAAAGGMLVAPNIVKGQKVRNDQRDEQ